MENSDTPSPAPAPQPADAPEPAVVWDPPRAVRAYGWPDARADYAAGEAAGVVAARLGVTERTLHRHAAREGWRKMDHRRLAGLAGDRAFVDQAEFEPDSPLGLFVSATEYEVGELLLDPEPMRYIRFAFRRSAEAAVRGRPAEALVWARLVAVLDRVAPGVTDTRRAFNSADHMRAIYAEKLRAAMEDEEGEDDAPPDDGAGADPSA